MRRCTIAANLAGRLQLPHILGADFSTRGLDSFMHIHRRTFASAALAAAASIAAPSLLAQGKVEKPKLAIAVGGKAAFYYLPLTISEQLGYFKAEGLDVEISDFAGGAKALQALVGGSADVVSGAYEHTINMLARSARRSASVW